MDTLKESLRKPWVWLGIAAVAIVTFIIRLSGRDSYVQESVPAPAPEPSVDTDVTSEFTSLLEDMMDQEDESRREMFSYLGDLARQINDTRLAVAKMPAAMSESLSLRDDDMKSDTGTFTVYGADIPIWIGSDEPGQSKWVSGRAIVDDPYEKTILTAKQNYKEAEARGDTKGMEKYHIQAEQARLDADKAGVELQKWAAG